MKRFMRKPHESRRLLFCKKNERDDRGSAIVIVIVAMAMITILATTIVWASYLNYRIKVNDLRVKNSFYSAETVVEQILAGVKKDVVAASVNEAYQEVVSNWDALGTDANRESYFLMAYIEQVEKRLNVTGGEYDKSIIEGFVDDEFWNDGNPNGFIVDTTWNNSATPPIFKTFDENKQADPNKGSMTIKNICVEFYDGNGLLSIINTDIAIDVPKLQFTQAGTIDRLYPYVFVGDEGIVAEDGSTVSIDGSIYGGVDDQNEGGIQIGKNSHVLVENAAYIISGGDIVVGNDPNFITLVNQDAELVVRDLSSGGVGYRTNVYANGLAVNSGHLSISGKMYIANDLTLSGKDSIATLSGQYLGYGDENGSRRQEPGVDAEGNETLVNVNPAGASSAIVINGKNSTVDLTGLNTLLLAGRAYVSLDDDEDANALPHILMGESISVKSNQIAYLVPPECVGTLDGRTIIGQNPVSFSTWGDMVSNIDSYTADGGLFKIVDAEKVSEKLGGTTLGNYGISSIEVSGLGDDILSTVTELNRAAESSNIRFLYMGEKRQVYLYLVMDAGDAEEYFAAYYNVNSNKTSLDSYFNQYASGGIKLKENVQGYTVVGNSMVSLTNAANGENIETTPDGEKLVRLLSSVTFPDDEDGDGDEGEGDGEDEQPTDPDAYQPVSDNITNIDNIRNEDELDKIVENCGDVYKNLNRNLTEENDGTENTVFDNLIMRETPPGSTHQGLEEYLDDKTNHQVEFTAPGETPGEELKAVLVDTRGGTYQVDNPRLRLVIAIGDVEVKSNFQGLIIASGTVKVAQNATVTCKKDGEGVYRVLQATNEIDDNVPANILRNGSGMVESGFEEAETDEFGNLSIDYSDIVRYENWIKK